MGAFAVCHVTAIQVMVVHAQSAFNSKSDGTMRGRWKIHAHEVT